MVSIFKMTGMSNSFYTFNFDFSSLGDFFGSLTKKREPRNFLVIGGTGSGKTTFINFMLRVEKGKFVFSEDDRRIQETNERGDKSRRSSTKECITYENKTMNWKFIDTPGLGDTFGYKQDLKNMEKLLNFFKNQQGTLGEIDCILFLEEFNQRESFKEKYVLDCYKTFLPKGTEILRIITKTTRNIKNRTTLDNPLSLINDLPNMKDRYKKEISREVENRCYDMGEVIKRMMMISLGLDFNKMIEVHENYEELESELRELKDKMGKIDNQIFLHQKLRNKEIDIDFLLNTKEERNKSKIIGIYICPMCYENCLIINKPIPTCDCEKQPLFIPNSQENRKVLNFLRLKNHLLSFEELREKIIELKSTCSDEYILKINSLLIKLHKKTMITSYSIFVTRKLKYLEDLYTKVEEEFALMIKEQMENYLFFLEIVNGNLKKEMEAKYRETLFKHPN